MRVLLTGGSGYVGKHLVEALLAKDFEVANVSRPNSANPLGVTPLNYSGKAEEIEAFCRTWRPDAIVHLAADVSKGDQPTVVDSLVRANVLLPVQLASAASEANVGKFINISTFSTTLNGTDYYPQTLYAATKKACEDVLLYFHQSRSTGFCTLCFYDVYGPRQPHARFLNAVIDAVKRQVPLHMTAGEQDICFLYVDDAVDAIIYALLNDDMFRKPQPQIFTVHGPEVFEVRTIPAAVAKGCRISEVALIYDKPYRQNEIMRFAPPYPLLPGWRAKYTFSEGLAQIFASE